MATKSTLHGAARRGKAQVVAALIAEGGHVNAYDHRGISPLVWAVTNNHLEVVRLLLAAGASLELRHLKNGSTALGYSGNPAVVETLLDAGADVDAMDHAGTTPLMLASMLNEEALLRLLLFRGADPRLRNRDGKTALELAIDFDAKEEIVRLLQDALLCGGTGEE